MSVVVSTVMSAVVSTVMSAVVSTVMSTVYIGRLVVTIFTVADSVNPDSTFSVVVKLVTVDDDSMMKLLVVTVSLRAVRSVAFSLMDECSF